MDCVKNFTYDKKKKRAPLQGPLFMLFPNLIYCLKLQGSKCIVEKIPALE